MIRAALVVIVSLSASVANADDLHLAAAGTKAPDRTRVADVAAPVRDFQLTDQDGQAFGLQNLRGRPSLVFFGFTNCPNVCPPTMQKLRTVQRALEIDESKLVVAFISVDGERDTPEVVKRYLASFEPGFVGLTGDPKLVRDIAAGFSAVFFKGLPTDAAGGYNVEHTSQAYLVDKSGQLRATFYNAPTEDMVAVTRAIL